MNDYFNSQPLIVIGACLNNYNVSKHKYCKLQDLIYPTINNCNACVYHCYEIQTIPYNCRLKRIIGIE